MLYTRIRINNVVGSIGLRWTMYKFQHSLQCECNEA